MLTDKVLCTDPGSAPATRNLGLLKAYGRQAPKYMWVREEAGGLLLCSEYGKEVHFQWKLLPIYFLCLISPASTKNMNIYLSIDRGGYEGYKTNLLTSSSTESGGETLLRTNAYLKPGCRNTVVPYIGLTSIKDHVPYLTKESILLFLKVIKTERYDNSQCHTRRKEMGNQCGNMVQKI